MSYTRTVLFGANTKRMVAHFITSSQMHYSNSHAASYEKKNKNTYIKITFK